MTKRGRRFDAAQRDRVLSVALACGPLTPKGTAAALDLTEARARQLLRELASGGLLASKSIGEGQAYRQLAHELTAAGRDRLVELTAEIIAQEARGGASLPQRRRRRSPQVHRTPIDWNEQPLGKVLDTEIARAVGVAPQTVYIQRMKRGIAAPIPGGGGAGWRRLTARVAELEEENRQLRAQLAGRTEETA